MRKSTPMLMKATISKFSGSQNIQRKKSKWEQRLVGKKGSEGQITSAVMKQRNECCFSIHFLLIIPGLLAHWTVSHTFAVGNSISIFQSKNSLTNILRGLSPSQVDGQYLPSYCWYYKCPTDDVAGVYPQLKCRVISSF